MSELEGSVSIYIYIYSYIYIYPLFIYKPICVYVCTYIFQVRARDRKVGVLT